MEVDERLEWDGYEIPVENSRKCRRPNTHESTRTRLAHGSQACDGGGSTGEGDHPGILHAVDIFFFFFFFFIFRFSLPRNLKQENGIGKVKEIKIQEEKKMFGFPFLFDIEIEIEIVLW